MFLAQVSTLVVLGFFIFLHDPFFSYASKVPTPTPPVDNISIYNEYIDTNLPSQNPEPSTPKPRKGLTFGRGNMIATVLTLVITLLNIFVYKLRELQEANLGEEINVPPPSLPFERLCRCFSLADIISATNNFSDELVLGRGGFGKVYKGVIDNGTVTVAIKRLNHMSKQGAPEFWNEIEMLSKFRHSHLVSLIGYCNIGKEMMIVYEYMVNGTLADHLHKIGTNGSGNSTLSWVQRLKICIGAAHGLDYLHTGTGVLDRVIHRDVKSSNILLDENWAAKISDFGMSKVGPANTSITHVSTNVKGTFGYLDPEYFLTRKLTRKSDVYSFGVVLFEVLCGRPVIDLRLDDEQRGLAGWAQQNFKEGTLDQIIDPSLRGQIKPDSLKTFAEIADQCLHMFSRKRPTMAEVVVSLELALTSQERVDSFVLEEFFNEIQENPNSSTDREDIINPHNDWHQQEQIDEIIQPGDARNEHPRAKPIKMTALTRIVRQAFLGTARVISGNKLPKVKRTSQQSNTNNKEDMATVGNKLEKVESISERYDEYGDSGINKEEMATVRNKREKVESTSKQYDANGDSDLNKDETMTTWSREEKVNRIFQFFDTNRDGGLGPEEMAALVVAVNPRVKFTDDQINAIIDEVFRTYNEFIDGDKGLTFNGLLQTYEDGAGDPDRDLASLGFDI